MDRTLRLGGKVAVVTGASRGIGRGIALRLASEGADVVVNYRSHPEEALEVAEAIRQRGSRALVWQTDVADRDAVARMFAAVVEHFGRIDITVANAALSIHGPVIEAEWEDVLRTVQVTQFGVFHTVQLAAQQMVRQATAGPVRGGKIVMISSVHEELAMANSAPYNMAKAAINHLGRTMAAELAHHRISVNMINPGWIEYARRARLRHRGGVDRRRQAVSRGAGSVRPTTSPRRSRSW